MGRPAPAIVALQSTLNLARPGRTLPDWVAGDADHQTRQSDHNEDDDGLYCAVDVRDGDALDDGLLYQAVKAGGTRNPVKYAINNGRIWSPERGEHDYYGENAHETHCHISVTQAGKYQTGQWYLPGITVDREDNDMTSAQAAQLAEVHRMLKALVRPRRTDKADHDPTHVDLGDILTAQERQHD